MLYWPYEYYFPMAEQRRILVVDDDAETRGLYADYLREAGFVVDEASNGLEALEQINEQLPDLVLSGIIMPQMDGFALVEALKKNVTTATLPIIFLSHLGRQEDQERSKEMGVSDFIVRDVTPLPEAIARIRSFFNAAEYLVAIDPGVYDGRKFARDMSLPENFECGPGEGGEHYVLRLRSTDQTRKHFTAEIICA